jgi:hypothetical protein
LRVIIAIIHVRERRENVAARVHAFKEKGNIRDETSFGTKIISAKSSFAAP